MNTNAFALPATFAQLWVDGSVQIMRASTDFWAGLMSAAPKRTRTSTTSPWWMPPQHPQLAALAQASSWPSAFASGAWGPTWPGAMPLFGPLTSLAAYGANPLFPWLSPSRPAPSPNPFMLWGQMWLEAASPSVHWPLSSTRMQASEALWAPAATVYRTANGHAMAAVLRTMADAVEPKPAAFNPAHYWPTTLGTRH